MTLRIPSATAFVAAPGKGIHQFWKSIQSSWRVTAEGTVPTGMLGEDVDRVARRRRQLVGELQDIAKAEKQRQLLAEQSNAAKALIQTRQGPDAAFELGMHILKCRIAEAAARREAWRLGGREEKYLEAYFVVEALELQHDELRRRHADDPLAR